MYRENRLFVSSLPIEKAEIPVIHVNPLLE